jgi:hypothetical protein
METEMVKEIEEEWPSKEVKNLNGKELEDRFLRIWFEWTKEYLPDKIVKNYQISKPVSRAAGGQFFVYTVYFDRIDENGKLLSPHEEFTYSWNILYGEEHYHKHFQIMCDEILTELNSKETENG